MDPRTIRKQARDLKTVHIRYRLLSMTGAEFTPIVRGPLLNPRRRNIFPSALQQLLKHILP